MSDQAVEDRSITGRRYAGEQPSLGRLNASVGVPKSGHWLRRLFAFTGPGYLISVGYMDPGNWATDISGGSKFGYTLLFVIALSNVMAIVLQALAVRLGIACDLAEVIGTAIALNLLFRIPLALGAIITAADAFLVLFLMQRGFRTLEAFIA